MNTSSNYSLKDHEAQLSAHPILLYMKGTPKEPLCGFSKLAVQLLNQCDANFMFIDVLHPDIRSELKRISKWPTFPQCYVRGELLGGSDIMSDLYASGKLQKVLLHQV